MLDTKALAQATAAIVKEHVNAAVTPLLKRIEELESRQMVKGDPGANGRDGLSVTIEDVAPMIGEAVRSAVAAIPIPKDGSDGKDGRDGMDGKDGAAGKDGLGAASAMIDRSGHLILTMTDGSSKDLGSVVGKDGADGTGGKDGRPGADGKDGADGVGFDDLDVVETDEGLKLRFVRGGVVKEFPIPVPTDNGVWKEKLFHKGQGVTWGGSFWIAQRDTKEKPDTADSGWRLAVKKGRDGKDAVARSASAPAPLAMR